MNIKSKTALAVEEGSRGLYEVSWRARVTREERKDKKIQAAVRAAHLLYRRLLKDVYLCEYGRKVENKCS